MRWGIVGHGGIAPTFIEAARGIGHDVVAVAGRDPARATSFATKHSIGSSGCDVSELVGEVEAAYVCTPHSSHRDVSIALLNAGVPVLCEKPMGVGADQVRQMVEVARSAGVFLMEAMWTRHLPVMATCRSWIQQGLLGEIQTVEAAFGFKAPYDPTSRLWAPEFAGGSLLDIGIYTLVITELAFQSLPVSLDAEAEISPSGVDASISVTARYPSGGSAALRSAINADLGRNASITGSKGRVDIPEFWRAEKMTLLSPTGEKVDEVHHPHRVNGFEYQIAEMARCLDAGLMECPTVPWAWSVALAALMDEIRSRAGIVYPSDKEARS